MLFVIFIGSSLNPTVFFAVGALHFSPGNYESADQTTSSLISIKQEFYTSCEPVWIAGSAGCGGV
jgi:hypothetical protein